MADPTSTPTPDITPPSDMGALSDPSNTDAPAVLPDVVPADSRPAGQPVPKLPPPDKPPVS